MEKVTYKRYKAYQLILTMILVAMMITLVGLKYFVAALIVFAISIILIMILRKKVKGVLSDERLDNIAGKASKIVLTTFALLMAAAGITLVSLRDVNSLFLIIGNLLIFLECGMMLFYVILFKYYSNKRK